MRSEQLNITIKKLKRALKGEMRKGNYENALRIISVTAAILYSTNYYYRDNDLETALNEVSKHMTQATNDYIADNDKVVFFDGFGLNSRGLIQIYLKALCKIKKVVYITYDKAKENIPDVLKIIEEYDCEALFLKTNQNHVDTINDLVDIVNYISPGHFFFYSTPEDVVATTTMFVFENKLKRYQINLTDHAFWLGADPIDVCIDFRDYGASISKEYRKIPKEKIVCLPYYPVVNEKEPFEGFPFEFKTNQKIVFSGGSLYKTLGEGNKYYEIVNYILQNHNDTIFWYAGNGDSSELDKIISRYPNRAYHTGERRDLFQVLKHCYLYLSTYPLCGGLMFQYAAKAGKIPITLKNGAVTEDFLLNQSMLGIEYDSLNDLYREIDKLLTDRKYHDKKEEAIKDAIISPKHFDSLVKDLVDGKYEKLKTISFKIIDTAAFQKTYLDEMDTVRIDEMIATRRNVILLKHMPFRYIHGSFSKIIKKIS